MMKRLLLLMLFALPAFGVATPATVTFHIATGSGTAQNQSTYADFELLYCGANQARVLDAGGSKVLVGEDTGSKVRLTKTPDSTGLGTVPLYYNDQITCGALQGNTRWKVVYFVNGHASPASVYNITSDLGASVDLADLLPVTVAPAVPAPTGDSTYPRIDGQNLSGFTPSLPSQPATKSYVDTALAGSVASTISDVFGLVFADTFPGGSSTAKFDAATASIGSANKILVAPTDMAAGEPGTPNQLPDNIFFIDLRGATQSQGLRTNLSAAGTSNVRSKLYLQDNYGANTIGLAPSFSSATLYVHSYVDNPSATDGTIATINGTQHINSDTGNFTGALVGGEFVADANANNSSPRTVSDLRGVLGGAGISGNNSATSMVSVYAAGPANSGSGVSAKSVSLYAQAPSNPGSGTTTNAYSIIAEAPISATGNNYGVYSLGKVLIDLTLGVGGFAQDNIGIFERNSSMTGATQVGIQTAPVTTSAATTEGGGLFARADTAAAAFTQALNTGIHVQNPTKGAGSTITEANGLRIDDITSGSTNFAIKTLGAAKSSFAGGIISPTYQTTLSTPATSGDSCTAGEMWADTGFVYVCTSSNTIKRATLSAF